MPSAHPSRTPSPAAPPPIAQTPGPRASALSASFSNALTHTLRTCSYAAFSACFPTPATHAVPILKSVHTQITAKIEESAQREFEEILAERDVVRGLNELERVMGEAARRRREGVLDGPGVAPHTLPPEPLYLAHLAPFLASAEQELQKELREVQAENESLARGIQGQREQVEGLLQGLEAVVTDLEGANQVMGEVVEGGEIRRDTVGLDDELRAAGTEREMKL